MRDQPPTIQHPAYESVCRQMARQTRQQIWISLALITFVGTVAMGLGWLGCQQAQGDRPLPQPDAMPLDSPTRLY